MRTGRFAYIAMSNESVILNLVRIITLFIACGLIVAAHAQTEESGIAEPEGVKDAAFASKLGELLTTVYCYCGCTRETIEVCVCGTAAGIEASFRDALTKGKTVDEIRTAYLEEHGPQYYAVMPAEGINLLAYIMPVVILVLIGGVVFVVLRRSTRSMQRAVVTSDAHGKPESRVSHETVKQVEAELERYKRGS